jgi:hypothetical protein
MRNGANVDHVAEEVWHVLVFGLPRPDKNIALGPGVVLRPLRFPLDSFDLLAAGAAGFRQSGCLEPLGRGCTAEIVSQADATGPPGYNVLNRAWLALTMLVLRGYTTAMGVACSEYSWDELAHPQNHPTWDQPGRGPRYRRCRDDLPPFKGSLLDYHIKLFSSAPAPLSLVDADTSWVLRTFETCDQIAGESLSFQLALEAASDWRFAKERRSAVARLWAGIEALLQISTELTYRTAILAASLLEPRGQGRLRRFQAIKKLYGLRSKAVHGAAVSDAELQDTVSRSFDLLRSLLLAALEVGHPLAKQDFDKALFF